MSSQEICTKIGQGNQQTTSIQGLGNVTHTKIALNISQFVCSADEYTEYGIEGAMHRK